MRFLDLAQARAFIPVQREGARLLQTILSGFDLTPLPDGTVRLSIECAPELVDRLAVWGASVEDFEDDGDLDQADADMEADARDALVTLPSSNVIVAEEVIEHRKIRAAARQQLDSLLALPREEPLPALEPRSELISVQVGRTVRR